ncbi:MAG: hypothetical protein J6S60_09270 [Oscillospiraceae bacterium]|nr:hypothetical protein [Oscillospiraceae bacterium]
MKEWYLLILQMIDAALAGLGRALRWRHGLALTLALGGVLAVEIILAARIIWELKRRRKRK